jgi:hypothetical protein
MPEHGSFATVTARQQRLFVPSRIDLFAGKGALCSYMLRQRRLHPGSTLAEK